MVKLFIDSNDIDKDRWLRRVTFYELPNGQVFRRRNGELNFNKLKPYIGGPVRVYFSDGMIHRGRLVEAVNKGIVIDFDEVLFI